MRAIIFDVDGTLLHSMAIDSEIFERSIKDVLGPVPFPASFNEFTNVSDKGIVEELLAKTGKDQDPAIEESIRSRFLTGLSDHIETSGPFAEVEGAGRFLNRLSEEADTCVAIATGCWRASANMKLESSGIDISGFPLASCDDSPVRTEIMQAALAKIEGPFDSITYFGDAEWDVKACKALGWNFVAVGPDVNGLESYDGFSI